MSETKGKKKSKLAVDYAAARRAAKNGNVREVLNSLLCAQIGLREDLGTSVVGEAQMPHIFTIVDKLRGYENPSMGGDNQQVTLSAWLTLDSSGLPTK